MFMTEDQIEEIRKAHKLHVTRRCDNCAEPIQASVLFRISTKYRKELHLGGAEDDEDFCSRKCEDEWIKKTLKKGKKKMSKTKKDREDDEEEDELEDETEEEETDEEAEEEEEEEEDDEPKKAPKKVPPKKKKAAKKDDDDDEEEADDDDDDKPKKKKKVVAKKKSKKDDDDDDDDEPKKKKKSSMAPVTYDDKTPIGKMFNALKEAGKTGMKKEKLYKVGSKAGSENPHVLLAWIGIHGDRSGKWRTETTKDHATLVFKKKAK